VPEADFSPAERQALAARVLRQSLHVRRGENVVIETWTGSVPWADALVAETRRIGAHPIVVYESEPGFWTVAQGKITRAMGALGGHELALLNATDVWVYLPGPADRARLHAAPKAARLLLDSWDMQWYRLARERGLRAARLELTSPDPKSAEFYGVDLATWRRELTEGSRLPRSALLRSIRPVVGRLERGHRMTITHPNGTRLELKLKQRPVSMQDGQVGDANLRSGRFMTVLPGGALYVTPDERFAEGVFLSNRPSRHGRGTFGRARWTFRAGRLAEYEIGEGRAEFEEAYRDAGRERDRPAFVSIGLNPKIRDAPLFEDFERGVVTLYIGRNVDFGGATRGDYRDFALLEGADLTVDDRPVLRDGKFV
jgi:hypothetical protein